MTRFKNYPVLGILAAVALFVGYKTGYRQAIQNAHKEPQFGVIIREGLTLPTPTKYDVIDMVEKYGTHPRFLQGKTICERLIKSFAQVVDFVEYAADPVRSSDAMIDGDDLRENVLKSAYYITTNCGELAQSNDVYLRKPFEEARMLNYISLFRYR